MLRWGRRCSRGLRGCSLLLGPGWDGADWKRLWVWGYVMGRMFIMMAGGGGGGRGIVGCSCVGSSLSRALDCFFLVRMGYMLSL